MPIYFFIESFQSDERDELINYILKDIISLIFKMGVSKRILNGLSNHFWHKVPIEQFQELPLYHRIIDFGSQVVSCYILRQRVSYLINDTCTHDAQRISVLQEALSISL